jgi:hypothetical protein
MKLSRNLNGRRRSLKGGRPRECPPLNMVDCGKNQNCSWSSKTNKCSKKRVSKVKAAKPVVSDQTPVAPVKKSVKKSKTAQAPESVAPVKKSVKKPVKKSAAPTKKVYQAKFIEINPDNWVKHSQMSKKINEYLKDKKNKVNIGDILYVETDTDRPEYNCHIVLPGRKALYLGYGWGGNWEAGGIIDQKDILHKYNVKYDNILSKKSGNYYFDQFFRGKAYHMDQEITNEFKKNDLLTWFYW